MRLKIIMGRHLGNTIMLGREGDSSRMLQIPSEVRALHMHVCGSSGTGKSRLLQHMIQQDIVANRKSKCGVLLLDPHGSLYDLIVAWLVRHNVDRPVILIDLRQDDWVLVYNLMRHRAKMDASVVVSNFVQAIAHVWDQKGTSETPRFARWAANVLHTLYRGGFALTDFPLLFDTDPRVRSAMTKHVQDQMTRCDWDYAHALKPHELHDQTESTRNRLKPFAENETLRRMFGQTSLSFDFETAMDDGAIVLVNLSCQGGRISDTDSGLFGSLLISDLWNAAQNRGKWEGVRPFYVYIDEFQRFVTPTIAANLDQARGYGLHMTLAHQFPRQLLTAGSSGQRVYDSVMENAQNKVAFRLTNPENLEAMAKLLFMGVMNPDEIKHKLYSTKVLSHREETRTSRSHSHMNASAFAEHESESCGSSTSGSESFDVYEEPLGVVETSGDTEGYTAGRTHSTQHADTRSESEIPMLIPEMGKEEASRQYRSLEEQLHRAMVSLFDQRERQFTTRIVGMRAPVTVRTPDMPNYRPHAERVREYVEKRHEQWAFVRRSALVVSELQKREVELRQLVDLFSRSVAEPSESRRRKA